MKTGTTKAAGKKETTRKEDSGAVQKKGRKPSQKELVEQAIQNIGSKVEKDEVKGTVGDLIRLLEFQKKLEEEEPKNIEVKWVDDKSGD